MPPGTHDLYAGNHAHWNGIHVEDIFSQSTVGAPDLLLCDAKTAFQKKFVVDDGYVRRFHVGLDLLQHGIVGDTFLVLLETLRTCASSAWKSGREMQYAWLVRTASYCSRHCDGRLGDGNNVRALACKQYRAKWAGACVCIGT